MIREKRWLYLFLLLFFLAAVYLFVFGESGLLARQDLRERIEALESRIVKLEEKKRSLSSMSLDDRVLPSGEGDTPAWIEGQDKVVVFRGREESVEEIQTVQSDSVDVITHLRIVWLVISVLAVTAYCVYFCRRDGREGPRL